MICCCPFVRSIKKFFCNTLSRLAQFICVTNSSVSTPKFNIDSRCSTKGLSASKTVSTQTQIQIQGQSPTATAINSGDGEAVFYRHIFAWLGWEAIDCVFSRETLVYPQPDLMVLSVLYVLLLQGKVSREWIVRRVLVPSPWWGTLLDWLPSLML